ncbi:MAG TPA: hypothetical protein VG713_20865, partial [Pirellulales bacterium]|nr:hypothetical protein [Pirellulales bacterium]
NGVLAESGDSGAALVVCGCKTAGKQSNSATIARIGFSKSSIRIMKSDTCVYGSRASRSSACKLQISRPRFKQ